MSRLPADWNDDDQGLEALAGGRNCPPPSLVLAASESVLPAAEQQQIQRHIAECKLCQVLCREMNEPEAADPTGAEKAAIWAKIEARQPKLQSVWSWLWKPALGLALASTAATLFVLNNTHPAPKPKKNEISDIDRPKPPSHLPVEMAAVKLPVGDAIIWRGSGDDKKSAQTAYLRALGEALKPYRANQPEDAARALEQVEAKFPKGAEAAFYRGVSLLLAGQDTAAVLALEKARGLAPAALRADIQYYLALSYEHTDRNSEAAALFRTLCDEPGERHTQSCDALQKLK